MPKTDKPVACAQFDADTLAQALDRAALFIATDDSRPVLTGVMMRFSPDGLTLAAADGHTLLVTTIPAMPDGVTGEARVILPGATAKEWAKAIRRDRRQPLSPDIAVRGAGDVHTLTLKTATGQQTADAIPGQFPAFEQLIPDDAEADGSLFAVNPHYLERVGRALKHSVIARVYSTSPSNPIKVVGKDAGEHPITIVVMPMFVQWGENDGPKAKSPARAKAQPPAKVPTATPEPVTAEVPEPEPVAEPTATPSARAAAAAAEATYAEIAAAEARDEHEPADGIAPYTPADDTPTVIADAVADDLTATLDVFSPKRWRKHRRDRVYLNNLDPIFGEAKRLHGYSRRGCRVWIDVEDRTLRVNLASVASDVSPAAMQAVIATAVKTVDPRIAVTAA